MTLLPHAGAQTRAAQQRASRGLAFPLLAVGLVVCALGYGVFGVALLRALLQLL